MLKLILLETLGCHLCREAAAIIAFAQLQNTTIETVDIATDNKLLAKYQTQIPVLLQPTTERCLLWPFDAQQLLAFVHTLPHD